MSMTFIEAAYQVLKEAGRSLTQDEIAKKALQTGLIKTYGKTPERSIGANIYVDIKRKGSNSRFRMVKRGLFGLSEWGAAPPKPDTIQEIEPGHFPPVIVPSGNIADDLLQKILSLSPSQFEELVGKVLEVKGLSVINITGRPGDRGIDGEAKVAFLDIHIAFQAKRYEPTNTISYQDVAAFKGSLSTRGLQRGVFVTTSSFSSGAKEAAEQGEPKIVLVDGNALVAILIEHDIGVIKVPVIETKIDDGFFDSL